MSDDLITIPKLIKQLLLSGASLGNGNPKEHLAYLTKIHLLPQSIRRKINGKMTGCYPTSVVETIKKIEDLKQEGLTYSQIKFVLREKEPEPQILLKNPDPTSPPLWTKPQPLTPPPSSSGTTLAFLIIGLFIGYLLAINNLNSRTVQLRSNPDQTLSALPETKSKEPIWFTAKTSPVQEIYVIAVPNQNLSRLGKTNVLDLISSQ